MKQKIHINDQGELLLIEAPEPIRKSQGVYDFIYPDLKREYDQALTSAIEKGIRFRDQEATKWLLINEFNGKENMRGWFQPGKSFDLSNSYTAEVVDEEIPCPDGVEGCEVYHTRKVAVLTPLKQEHGIAYEVKTGSSYENFRVLTEAEKEELLKPGNGEGFRIKILGQSEGRLFVNGEEYVKKQSGEPGNEAKKGEEYILCAANYYNDGKTHEHAPKNITIGFITAGRRHHNCIHTFAQIVGFPYTDEGHRIHRTEVQGFITNTNRFVDRKEAYQIAFKADQIKGPNKGYSENSIGLTSEDLY